MSVRPAEPRDLSRIAEILVFGKRTAYRDIFRDDAGSFVGLQVLPLIEEYRADDRLLAQTLVYDDGIVRGMLRREETGPEDMELWELYVEPAFTGAGFGHRLMEAFLAECRREGRRRVGLWVLRDNAGARRFYESLGFTPDGREQPVEGAAVRETRYILTL